MIFRFPDTHGSVGHGHIDQRKQPRQLDGSEFCLVGNVNGNLIIESRRRTQAGRSIVCPKGADKGLLGRALRRRSNPVATKSFRFVISRSICGAGKGRRWRRPELSRELYHERSAFTPMRAQSDRAEADRILSPVTKHVACRINVAEMNFRLPSHRNARGEYRGRICFPNAIPLLFCLSLLARKRSSARSWSKAAFCDGKRETRVSCAACATAAMVETGCGAESIPV